LRSNPSQIAPGPNYAYVIRRNRQDLLEDGLGRREPGRPVLDRQKCRDRRLHGAQADPRLDNSGVERQRAFEEALPLPQGVGRRGSVEAGHALKIEVHRVGIRHLFRASRLGGDELGVQRACQARDDFILHVEEIGQRLIEPLGSKVITRRLHCPHDPAISLAAYQAIVSTIPGGASN
jgi:hypothetical protein